MNENEKKEYQKFEYERIPKITPVTVFLVNGFQLRGTVSGFDCFVVILDTDGRQQVIYKHAISTIAPLHPVSLSEEAEET